MPASKSTPDDILADAHVDENGVSVSSDALEARLTEALSTADLTEAAAAAAMPRDDSDLYDEMVAELEAPSDELDEAFKKTS